jgi:hypothetical protein
MSSLQEIHNQHARYTDSMVHAFETHLHEIVAKAQANVLGQLQKQLSITDGVIDQTPANYRTLRKLNQMFLDAMDQAGYQRLVTAFVGEFPGQLPYLNEILELLSDQVQGGLPIANLSADPVLQTFQLSAADALNAVVEGVAGSVMQRSMLSVGGLQFGELAQTLAEKLAVSVPRAVTLADSSMTMFYRTANDRAFQVIEAGAPKQELKYKLSGPLDKLTRPWCEDMLARTKDHGLTRDEFNSYPNGQIPNPFISCGGWNCRHAPILDVTSFELAAREPAAAVQQAA